MPDLQRSDIIKVDLSRQLLRTNAGEILAMGDDCANRFGADLVRNGLPVNVDGCLAIGYFIRPDGYTCMIQGVAEGSQAYVDLPEACYTSEGVFSLAIKLKSEELNCTLRIIDGYLRRTETGIYVDPGTVVPDIADLLLQIDRMEQGTAAASQAAINATNAANEARTAANTANSAANAANQAATEANASKAMQYSQQAKGYAENASAAANDSAVSASASAASATASASSAAQAQKIVDDLGDAAKPSNGITVTVPASAWAGDEAPFTATVACSNAKAGNILHISPAGHANSAEQRAAITAALITATGQGAGSITLTADGEKPEMNFSINVVEVM